MELVGDLRVQVGVSLQITVAIGVRLVYLLRLGVRDYVAMLRLGDEAWDLGWTLGLIWGSIGA